MAASATKPASSPARKPSNRLAYLDWARGAAALIMLQGHVFQSFTHKDLRNDSPYVLSQFVGGITPAVFLFLTGVTLAFLMDSRAKAGLPAWTRVTTALRRAGYLFLVAILFRVQLWSFAFGQSPWTDLFKVDILNCMGLCIAMLAPMAIFDTRDRVRFGAFTGLLIAGAAPIISALPLGWLHPLARNWFVPSYNMFPIFPWGAFVAFGLSAGSILRLVKEEDVPRLMQWAALFGIGLIVGARYFASLPYSPYPNSEFWLNSPALILIKLGVILLILVFGFLWTRYVNPSGWSFLRQLGTTSLLVYWVHTELVYGRWLWFWKESLPAAQTALMAVCVILLMVLLSVAKTGWKGGPALPVWLRQTWQDWRAIPARAAAGD
jgi:uncharacterized membrane protein